MAKDKKRGFFSWLGFGSDNQQEQTSTPPDTADENQPAASEIETSGDIEQHSVFEQDTDSQPTAIDVKSDETTARQTTDDIDLEEPHSSQPPLIETINNEHDGSASHVTGLEVEQHLPAIEIEPTPELPVTDVGSHEAEVVSISETSSVDNAISESLPEITEQSSAILLDVSEQPLELSQEKPTKLGFFARLKQGLLKTRQNVGSGFLGLFRGKKIDDDLFDELEEHLLIADVGVSTTRRIIDTLTQHASRKQLKDADMLYGKLREVMSEIIQPVSQPLDISGHKPFVILMVGVNGVGKTTTIGKLARQFQQQGKSVMLAAGDTFRAAAVEQLQVWGQRNNISVVAQHSGADSASVIYDAMQAAQARQIDVLIADTAGRLQNKSHLMDELKKVVRVMKKLDANAPHEIMLTIDAGTGQNAVSQVKLFHEAVGLTGITLTKLDGTAKGGVIFAVADQFSIPIRYIGVGEGIEDLRPFNANDFIEALFARED